MHPKLRFFALASTLIALASCGGDGGSSTSNSSSSTVSSSGTSTANTNSTPGGLYVGYYQEDPTTNPEDPTPGAFSLNLPLEDSSFKGSMYFTYVGCQNSNVGEVSGTKSGLNLSGSWSGLVDNLQQTGSYAGTYSASSQTYSGTYTNAGGKQYRNLLPCVEYTIAPNGTWEMFPIGTNTPSSFTNSISGRTISWSAINNAEYALVYILDPLIAQSSGNPVVWQQLVYKTTSASIPSNIALANGKEYITAVATFNNQTQRVAFSSTRFTH